MPTYTGKHGQTKPKSQKTRTTKIKHRYAQYRDSVLDQIDETPNPANRLPLKPDLQIPPNPQRATFARESGEPIWYEPKYDPPEREDSRKVAHFKNRYRKAAQKRSGEPKHEIRHTFKTKFERDGERTFNPLKDPRPGPLDETGPPKFRSKKNRK